MSELKWRFGLCVAGFVCGLVTGSLLWGKSPGVQQTSSTEASVEIQERIVEVEVVRTVNVIVEKEVVKWLKADRMTEVQTTQPDGRVEYRRDVYGLGIGETDASKASVSLEETATEKATDRRSSESLLSSESSHQQLPKRWSVGVLSVGEWSSLSGWDWLRDSAIVGRWHPTDELYLGACAGLRYGCLEFGLRF